MTEFYVHYFTWIVGMNELLFSGSLVFMFLFCHESLLINEWHPPERVSATKFHMLATTFAVTVNGTGMMAFRIYKSFATKHIKLLHALLHSISVGLIYYSITTSNENEQPDLVIQPKPFESIHTWLGLITMAFFIISFVSGFMLFMTPLKNVVGEKFSGMHALSGILCNVLLGLTILTGISEKCNDDFQYYVQIPQEKERPDFMANTETFYYLYASAVLMIFYIWNTSYITMNPYFEWTRVGPY